MSKPTVTDIIKMIKSERKMTAKVQREAKTERNWELVLENHHYMVVYNWLIEAISYWNEHGEQM